MTLSIIQSSICVRFVKTDFIYIRDEEEIKKELENIIMFKKFYPTALIACLTQNSDTHVLEICNGIQSFIQRGGNWDFPPKNLRKFYYYREISTNC